jgi:hypothetical protein
VIGAHEDGVQVADLVEHLGRIVEMPPQVHARVTIVSGAI